MSLGADIIEGMYSLSNLKPEIIEKFRKDINDEGWLLNKKVLERYSIDIEDKEYIRRREKIRIREEETARKKAALRPKELQPDNTVAASVLDKMEAKGTFKVLDSLFKERSELSTGFRKEYNSLLDRIMEREDFTFDEKGIETLRGRIGEYIRKQAEAGKDADKKMDPGEINELIQKRQEAFDVLLAPDLRKVFELVQKGVIGKDTARIFISPDAMNYSITDDLFEADLVKSLIARKERKVADAKTELKYKDLVVNLADGLLKDVGQIVIQGVRNGGINHENTDRIRTGNHYLHFSRKKGENENSEDGTSSDVRLYVTVKEENQNEMVQRLTEFLEEDKNKKFRGAFDFKLMTGLKDHRMENIVIYINSNRTNPEDLKEFIDGFSEKIRDITSEEESIPTTTRLKQGIGVAAEPSEVFKKMYRSRSTLNPLSLDQYRIAGNKTLEGQLTRYDDTVSKYSNLSNEQKLKYGKSKTSWNQFCGRLLILSAYIARHRLNRTEEDLSVSGDEEVKKEMKQVFQEFMLLSGIDTDTLTVGSTVDYLKKVKE